MQVRESESVPAPRDHEARQLLALDLAALLQRLGVTAVVRNADSGQALAYTDDALSQYNEQGPDRFERGTFTLCGVEFMLETPSVLCGHRPLDLTPRQATIVKMIAEGMRNQEIADELRISPHTVRRHVEALLRRLNVPNRAAAAVLLHARIATAVPRRRRGVARVA